jgi:multiple sugar transport system substrate-binding protein
MVAGDLVFSTQRGSAWPLRKLSGDVKPNAATKTDSKVIGTTPIILALLIVSMAAACGSSAPAAAPSQAGPTPTVTVPFELPATIAITGRFDDQTLAILDQQIAIFEEQNPDIKVAILNAPRTESRRHEAFLTQFAEGETTRDIYVLETTWLAEFDANGWLIDLREYLDDAEPTPYEIRLEDLMPAAIQASSIDGRLVALPWLVDGGLLYYRQDVLERYGYEPPTTWEQVQRIALEVTNEDLPYGLVWQGAAYESLTCNTLEFVWANGGEVLDESGNVVFDSVETRGALQQMTDFIEQGISPPEVTTYNETMTLNAFQSGDALFMRNWTYAWDRLHDPESTLAGRVGLAPLPASCLGGQSLALSVHSPHTDQAFRFMAFLVGYEQQLQIAQQGIQPPALQTVYQDPKLLATDPVFGDLLAGLATTRPRPQSPAYLEISEAIYTEVNKMLQGEQGAAETAENVQRRTE